MSFSQLAVLTQGNETGKWFPHAPETTQGTTATGTLWLLSASISYTKGQWVKPSPPRGDLKPTLSESLMSPIYETARLRKKSGWVGGVTPP